MTRSGYGCQLFVNEEMIALIYGGFARLSMIELIPDTTCFTMYYYSIKDRFLLELSRRRNFVCNLREVETERWTERETNTLSK